MAASLCVDRLAALASGRNPRQSVPVRITRRRAIAAGASAASLIGAMTWLGWPWIDNARGTRYVTAVGNARNITLKDGSAIALNTATELFIHYTSSARNLQLAHGEAFFTVVRDVSRPFAIRIGKWTVRSLASAFGIRVRSADITQITVTQGVVDIRPTTSSERRATRWLSEKQEATIDTSEVLDVRAISDEDIHRRFAWRAGMIFFDGQPLYEAVDEVNRYSRRRLVLDDSELAERRVVGVFRTSDTEAFLSTLHDSLGVQAIATDNVVLLRSRATP